MRAGCGAVLLALAAIASAPHGAAAQYAPQWHVGDWWVVKQLSEDTRRGAQWLHWRYSVVGSERIGDHECYILQKCIRGNGDTL